MLAGCGGGGGSSSTPQLTERSIHWAMNWGPILNGSEDDPPTRSSSYVLTLKGANPDGTDFIAIGGSPNIRPITSGLGSSSNAKVGTFQLEARFYLPQDSTGTVIGIARAVVSITSTNPSLVSITYPYPLSDPPGHIVADFQLDTSAFAVDSITVPAGQTIKAGVSSPLIFTAHPRGNIDHILALSPNSQTVQITSGADHLSYSNGSITGLTPGTATLTVTARGATSAQATITVTP